MEAVWLHDGKKNLPLRSFVLEDDMELARLWLARNDVDAEGVLQASSLPASSYRTAK